MEYKKRIYANFGSIILLEYNPDIDYIVETLQLPEIINILEQQRINGVFSGTREIEKTIELKIKEEKKDNEIASPYTKESKKYNSWVYIVIYIVIFMMIIAAIFWSVKQVTINKNVTDIISYGR